MRRQRGLTLVETLTVVGIVGILSSIAGVAFGPGLAKSRTKPACASNLRQVAQAYNLYLSDNDHAWPSHGGMVGNDYVWAMYKPPRACPLDTRWKYDDSYQHGNWSLQHPELRVRTTFLDGRPVPKFDPEIDVLARCLDHGIGGFSKGSQMIWVRDEEHLKGKVLGVRFDGSVRYVPPISCWEAYNETYVYPLGYLYRGCDEPTPSR